MVDYILPGEVARPVNILNDPNLTELQIRTLIANSALNGQDGAFRTDPVEQYYRSLAARSLYNPQTKSLNDYYTALAPIEELYLRNVLGIQDNDPQSVFTALGGQVRQPVVQPQQVAQTVQALQGGSDNSGGRDRDPFSQPVAATNQRYGDYDVGGGAVTNSPFGLADTQRGFYGKDFSTNPYNQADYFNDIYGDTALGPGLDSIYNDTARERTAANPQTATSTDDTIVDIPGLGEFTARDIASGLLSGFGGAVGGPVGGALGMVAGRALGGAFSGGVPSIGTAQTGTPRTTPESLIAANPGAYNTAQPAQTAAPAAPVTRTPDSYARDDQGRALRDDGSAISGSGGNSDCSGIDNQRDVEGSFGSRANAPADRNYSPQDASSFGLPDLGDRSGGSSNSSSRGGCWIYSTLYRLKKADKRDLLVIYRYHERLQTPQDYKGYVAWSKPVSTLFSKSNFIANTFSYWSKEYAGAKKYRLGISKSISLKQYITEILWDSINRVSGLIVGLREREQDEQNSTQQGGTV